MKEETLSQHGRCLQGLSLILASNLSILGISGLRWFDPSEGVFRVLLGVGWVILIIPCALLYKRGGEYLKNTPFLPKPIDAHKTQNLRYLSILLAAILAPQALWISGPLIVYHLLFLSFFPGLLLCGCLFLLLYGVARSFPKTQTRMGKISLIAAALFIAYTSFLLSGYLHPIGEQIFQRFLES